ncbi:hypothetical protein G6030_01680 [Dietzia sp. E1]|uniref:hypothetical protein n=1 Tax=Dietzia sp. E1 TaxID=328361 RepID=UPI0015F83787|nr:hypothetical protein [Dietzia sp. E1]MBB1020022.1 hypothetical protein [Dietzia sp. E1]
MDSQTVDTVTAIFALLAFVVSLFALYFARRSAIASEASAGAARDSAKHAGTSARAAKSSAESAKRSADAAETQTAISQTDFDSREPTIMARWDGHWVVTNTGGGPAYNVEVECDPPGHRFASDPGPTVDKGGEFYVLPTGGSLKPRSISISYNRTPAGTDQRLVSVFGVPRSV